MYIYIYILFYILLNVFPFIVFFSLIVLCFSKYMKYGCLRDILSNDKIQLSFKLKIKIAKDIGNGLKYLHNKEPVVVHRDLKTANIIIGYKKRTKKKVDDKHIFKNLQLQQFIKKKLNDGNDDEEEDSVKDDSSSSSSSSCSSDDDDEPNMLMPLQMTLELLIIFFLP